MKTPFSKIIACALVLGLSSLHAAAQLLDSARAPGIEVFTFFSKILNEKRKIRIQTPAGNDKFTAYPVLYQLDGEAQTNLVTGQVQYLSESYKIIPNIIVVGIDNTDRMRDLTPSHPALGPDGKPDTSAQSPFRNTGGGEKFLQFVKQELMPFVQNRYKTAPFNILSGHSLGALMSVYCLVNHPDYFNAYIAISPSFQWDDNALLKSIPAASFNKAASRLLFFSDANEDAAFHQNQLTFDSLLRKKPVAPRYKRMFYPEEIHTSEPVKAFYDAIRFIYPDWHLQYNSSAFKKTMTSIVIREHYATLSKTYGYNVLPPHDELITIARFLRNDPNRIKDGIDLLQWNAANYPASVLNLETLGDTFSKMGDTEKAIAAYRQALALDNTNKSLQQKLNSIVK